MKDYWNFNVAHISLKSDKSSSNSPQSLVINGLEVLISLLLQMSLIRFSQIYHCVQNNQILIV